ARAATRPPSAPRTRSSVSAIGLTGDFRRNTDSAYHASRYPLPKNNGADKAEGDALGTVLGLDQVPVGVVGVGPRQRIRFGGGEVAHPGRQVRVPGIVVGGGRRTAGGQHDTGQVVAAAIGEVEERLAADPGHGEAVHVRSQAGPLRRCRTRPDYRLSHLMSSKMSV